MENNNEQLVKALRECASDDPDCIYNCPYYNHDVCADDLKSDAAAAIEALQAEVKRLEPKHGEWVWIHRHHGGFKTAKGKCECGRDVYAQIDERYETYDPYCPFCGVMNDSIHLNYCPNCGADMRAKMEVQDGQK